MLTPIEIWASVPESAVMLHINHDSRGRTMRFHPWTQGYSFAFMSRWFLENFGRNLLRPDAERVRLLTTGGSR